MGNKLTNVLMCTAQLAIVLLVIVVMTEVDVFADLGNVGIGASAIAAAMGWTWVVCKIADISDYGFIPQRKAKATDETDLKVSDDE